MWEYPIWEVPRLGGGMTIGLIATIHVLVAHFSVGAGFLLAIGETAGRKKQNPILLDFLKRFSKALILVGFVFGAITGVAIWFSISLASTRATSALIHTFVWFWATEWVFFLVEIVAGYAYYSTWDKVSEKTHLTLGWIYAIAAWMSLFWISGILAFMMTPGDWLETRNVWDGFLNPTFFPTVGLRTISSLAFAGLYAILIANLTGNWTREERTRLINFGAWFLAPLVLMLPFAAWYFVEMPPMARHFVQGGAAAMTLFFLFGIAASTLVGIYAYWGLIRYQRYVNLETSCLLLAIAIIATVSMEFVREGTRKPFVIYGYLYSNGLTVPEAGIVNSKGVVASAPWQVLSEGGSIDTPEKIGRLMYKVQCSQCHVQGGFNDLIPLIQYWGKDLLAFNLDRIHELKAFMPPLAGTPDERKALVDYLWELKTARESSEQRKVADNHEPDPQS